MENRLCLNKKPKYELPDEVIVGEYIYSKYPDFEPDLCINNFPRNFKIDKKERTVKQLWIKTDNKKLISFIINYNWNNTVISTTSSVRHLTLPLFKKIILEEFYNEKV